MYTCSPHFWNKVEICLDEFYMFGVCYDKYFLESWEHVFCELLRHTDTVLVVFFVEDCYPLSGVNMFVNIEQSECRNGSDWEKLFSVGWYHWSVLLGGLVFMNWKYRTARAPSVKWSVLIREWS